MDGEAVRLSRLVMSLVIILQEFRQSAAYRVFNLIHVIFQGGGDVKDHIPLPGPGEGFDEFIRSKFLGEFQDRALDGPLAQPARDLELFIIEELVGKFTTRQSDVAGSLSWSGDGVVLVDGAATLRDLNRMLGVDFPLDGPRTLNGLIVEHLQDIPEVGVGVRVGSVAMEIVQTQDRKIKMVRLHRPAGE